MKNPYNNPLNIDEEKWIESEEIINSIGKNRLNKYTVLFANKDRAFGTGVLIKHNEYKGIVTAAHVAKKITSGEYPEVAIIVIPDDRERFPRLENHEYYDISYWDNEFNPTQLSEDPYSCKDLAFVEIPIPLISTIKATKEFVSISDVNETPESNLIGHGFVEIEGEGAVLSAGFVITEKKIYEGLDFLVSKVKRSTYGSEVLSKLPVLDFRGYSGGGLFDCSSESIVLSGIAFFQDRTQLEKEDEVTVLFYGPASILAFLSKVKLKASTPAISQDQKANSPSS